MGIEPADACLNQVGTPDALTSRLAEPVWAINKQSISTATKLHRQTLSPHVKSAVLDIVSTTVGQGDTATTSSASTTTPYNGRERVGPMSQQPR